MRKSHGLTRKYATRLLREVENNPERLLSEAKFLKPEFFPEYLSRAEKLIWHSPETALPFLMPAPEYAALLVDANPRENAADFFILAHSYLGNVLRRASRNDEAQAQFDCAGEFRNSASPDAEATYCRYLAKLCIQQKRPEAFQLLGDAISIYKRGNLVHRHLFGKCLVTRGIAYYQFDQPDRTLSDFTAALNHLSLQIDPMAYYCALHNLAVYAVLFGSDGDIDEALDNLGPARSVLAGVPRHSYAKIGMRWLFALLSFRRGEHAAAETKLLEVAEAFVGMKLPFDLGCVLLDLARLYLTQGRREEVMRLVRETKKTFLSIGDDQKIQLSIALWRQAFSGKVTDESLLDARSWFFEKKDAMAEAA